MRKFLRRLFLFGLIGWLARSLQEKKRQWATRPAADIRRDVVASLPSAVDPETKEKIADTVVKAVKGNQGVTSAGAAEPTAQTMTSPPAPEPPADLRREE